MKGFFFGCALALTTFCQYSFSATNETAIPISFHATQFNHISHSYLPRPTFATLHTRAKGRSWLNISMDRYAPDEHGASKLNNDFTQENCDDYIALIDKYLEWEVIAVRDGDIIDKKIGKAKNINFGITFSFFSGNAKDHFLTIGYSTDYTQYFDHDNAIALKELLIRYKNDQLKPLDTSKKYQ